MRGTRWSFVFGGCLWYRSFRRNSKQPIHVLHEIETTTTYISFINGGNYQFDSCPEGFTMKIRNSVNRIAISRFVNLYDYNHKRRPHEEIEKELQEGWKLLYKWAKNLKDNK